MSPTLIDLLRRAMEVEKETPAQRRAHAVSFAYGNVHLHNPAITREMVEREYDLLMQNCEHRRLNEDGICRQCGADRRF